MKNCYKCKQPYEGERSYCITCRRQIDNEYNSRRDKSKKYARIKLKKEANKAFVEAYLLKHPCSCGESDPIVLEFHHLKDKKYNVSEMMSSNSLETIKREISKCEVLCANCHRRVTYYQRKNQHHESNT